MKKVRIHATLASVGGVVLAGILFVLVALCWVSTNALGETRTAFAVFVFLSLATALYIFDAWSESLSLENGIVSFDSAFRPRRRINACAMAEVFVVHEGLNQERGIVSAVFRESDGTCHRLALGPLWRRHDLERFFAAIEETTGECKFVKRIR